MDRHLRSGRWCYLFFQFYDVGKTAIGHPEANLAPDLSKNLGNVGHILHHETPFCVGRWKSYFTWKVFAGKK
jgi:hypothetical protein